MNKQKLLTLVLVITLFYGCSREYRVDRYDLVAFVTSGKVEASCFLLGGGIEGVPIYRFLYKDKNGGVRQDYLYVRNVIIYEDGNVEPCIELLIDTWKEWNRYGILRYCVKEARAYVPRNSIKTIYKLNVGD